VIPEPANPRPELTVIGDFVPRTGSTRVSPPVLRVGDGWCGEPCLTESQAEELYLVEIGRLCAEGHPSVRPARLAGPAVGAGRAAGFEVVGPLPFAMVPCRKCRAYHLRRVA
jgi:hypothetical protein